MMKKILFCFVSFMIVFLGYAENKGQILKNTNNVVGLDQKVFGLWYIDRDSDGFGDANKKAIRSNAQPNGYVANNSDYDDTTANITNIAPQTFYKDGDGDGYGNPQIHAYYSIMPLGYVTNNSDYSDSTVNIINIAPQTFYEDLDGDTFGNPSVSLYYSVMPEGYVTNAGDYDDTTVNITNIRPRNFYEDADGDTFGNPNVSLYYSEMPIGYSTNEGDYDDTTVNITNIRPRNFYEDADGDTFGNPNVSLYCSKRPTGYVNIAKDIDDTNENITNIPPQNFYADVDGDTFGNPNVSVYYSIIPTGYVTNANDIDDANSNITNISPQNFYADVDGDTFGNPNVSVYYSIIPTGYVTNANDYDDTNVNITDIVPQNFYADADGDTFGNPSVSLYYSMMPTGYVTNANDYDDTNVNITDIVPQNFYADADGDTFGNPNVSLYYSVMPTGYVSDSSDIDDSNSNITNIPPQTFYQDADGDTFGNPNVSVYYSVMPPGYVIDSSDIDDSNLNITNIPPQTFYQDADGDTFGNPNISLYYSVMPNSYVIDASDMDDSNLNITNIPPQTFYQDADGDTFGNPNISLYYSNQPPNYVINNTDCNDVDASLNPGTKWYADTDGDGLGDPLMFLQQCEKPTGNYVLTNTDNCPEISGTSSNCDDLNPSSGVGGSGSLDQNYIITTIYKKPTSTVFANPNPSKARVNITYFDGLGRPIQQIANQQSASGKDIITHIEYDAFGRQTRDYLPFASESSTNMEFDQSALNHTQNFYETDKYENTANPFSEKKLESSPLNRVLKQAAPGTDWVMDAGREIKLNYQTNTDDEVKLYKATTTWDEGLGLYDISFSDEGNYVANQLYKTITYDENSVANPTDEKLGNIVEFKNKEGQVVLKRTYESNEKHDTYYVYDSYGNLTYVLPPMFTNGIGELDGLCYQYKYDNRNRLVEKKLPGKQWEFIVYDKLDHPVATGPAASPFKDETTVGWMITKYDAFGRPVYTGWLNSVSDSSARKSLQDAQNTATVLFESKQTSGAIDGIPAYYTNAIAPTSINLLTVNYYDNYVFPNVPAIPTTIEDQSVLANTKTLVTGSWTRVLTTDSATLGETATTFYDYKARPIRTALTNYLGGYTITDSKLDSFSGQLQYTINKHKRTTGDTEITVKDMFTYSSQDRLLTHTQQINGGAEQLLADNTYDELGQLTSKKVGNSSGAPLQIVDYTYNIRGWLTAINNDPTNNLVLNTTEKDLFGFKINYNKVEQSSTAAEKLYNGNIAETAWTTGLDNSGIVRWYGYKYDQLNRLKDATYQTPSLTENTNYYGENLMYDKNGNISHLGRNNKAGTSTLPYKGIMDDLTYVYHPENLNQLVKVSESVSGNKDAGFIDGNTTGDDYTYDINGNLIADKNKNITVIVYNHLNLPTKITFGTAGAIEYIYNAAGQKLEKIITAGTVVTSTNYLGGYQYLKPHLGSWTLQFFPTADGYFNQKQGSTNGVGDYVFQYKDHLGNVRLSYNDADKNGSIATTEIIEESNYYPFGLKHEGYNPPNGGGNSEAQKYKFQGQERQDELGLNWDSFKWRNYDYAIGRFMCIDPLAEKYPYNSTYAFQENKMGMGRELEGLELVLTHGTWAARDDKKLYSMDKADYKEGTWQKGFSQQVAKATGWDANSTYEFTWTGNNDSDDRSTAGQKLARDLMSENNPDRDAKHATLVGHSHGGNVNKVAKNFLEEAGWTVDIINIATPQRDDIQTNETGNGKYINFYNTSDVVQSLGAQHYYSNGDDRKDPNAQVNQEVTPSKNSWFSNSGGHSYHQDPEAQKQIINVIKSLF